MHRSRKIVNYIKIIDSPNMKIAISKAIVDVITIYFPAL